ncbi:MAG: protein-glutamate O-methyltransferase CheR [Pseudomonadota bacterium]
MKDAQFQFFADYVYQSAGIVLKNHKKQMLQSRLSRRLQRLGLSDFDQYIEHLETSPSEHQCLVNAVTTNLTYFFREAHHFEHFKTVVLPDLSDQRRPIRIWSAGCSSGEEPISIAISILETPGLSQSHTKILATDIDTKILETCRTGTYARDKAKDLSPQTMDRFFESKGGQFQAKGAILDRIFYLPLNLQGKWPHQYKSDVIFCRNVLIYFDKATKDRLINRFVDQLRPGGILYLGHSEALLTPHEHLKAEGHTIYRKVPANG